MIGHVAYREEVPIGLGEPEAFRASVDVTNGT
jgi:hypothetical protein